MLANILCYPPLGQSTFLARSPNNLKQSIRFTVVVECDSAKSDRSWNVVLWHNFSSENDWEESSFESDTEPELFYPNPTSALYTGRRYFSLILKGQPSINRPLRFTIKYRFGQDQSWIWANDAISTSDGELIFPSESISKSTRLEDYIVLDSGLSVKRVLSQSPDAEVWSLRGKTKPAKGRASSHETQPFGKPKAYSRWMSLVRLWSPWLAPRQGKSGDFVLDREAVFCSFSMHDGNHLALLAISGVDDTLALFSSGDDDEIKLSLRNDSAEVGVSRVVAAVGHTFEAAMAAVMYHARTILADEEVRDQKVDENLNKALQQEVKDEWRENWFDGITYCTWNGLGQNLTDQKIYGAMDSLERNDVHITNLIIDDNWQSLSNSGAKQFKRGWQRFEANKEGFPNGLKHTVSQIRSKQPNIKHIAVWHALTGYWGGIDPKGELAKEYKTVDVLNRKNFEAAQTRTMISAEDIYRFYDDFYQFLSSCGIDSVKTDAQFYMDEIEHADDRRTLMKPYQDAWATSSFKWFSMKIISCMSQIPQILFHSQLAANRPQYLLRNSDDFFPEVPSSHPWHIFCNAHNTLINQHLNALPDWDMFQTDHPYAGYHAAARCVSGGPIYFTDEPGKHDIGLIHQMTAATIQGKTIILRPDTIGKSVHHYVAYKEERLLEVGSYHGLQQRGTGFLGIFNVSQRRIHELIPIGNIPGILEKKEYIVHAHTTGAISEILKASSSEQQLISVALDLQGWEILSSFPVHDIGNSTKISVLGLIGKMTGAAAILDTEIVEAATASGKSKSVAVAVTLKALGVLGIFVSNLANKSIRDNFMVTLQEQPVPIRFVTKEDEQSVLKVDIEQAWEKLRLKPRSSFERTVKILVVIS